MGYSLTIGHLCYQDARSMNKKGCPEGAGILGFVVLKKKSIRVKTIHNLKVTSRF